MSDLNKAFLIGRLIRDPEYKTVGETGLARFTLASSKTRIVNGEKKEETIFIDCEAWGKIADIVNKYITKGKQVAVDGELKQDTWDGQDGKRQSKIKIKIDSIQMLGGNKQAANTDNAEINREEIPLEDIF